MIRYNLEYHQQADELAKENGFEFAVYMGHFRSALVFVPHHNDTFQYTEGFNYISINEKGAKWHCPFPPFGFPYKYDYLKKGRKLFRELEKKFKECNVNDPNWQHYAELYNAATIGNWGNPKILKNDLCLFLQEGDRLGRRVLLKEYYEQRGDLIISSSDGEFLCLKLE